MHNVDVFINNDGGVALVWAFKYSHTVIGRKMLERLREVRLIVSRLRRRRNEARGGCIEKSARMKGMEKCEELGFAIVRL